MLLTTARTALSKVRETLSLPRTCPSLAGSAAMTPPKVPKRSSSCPASVAAFGVRD